MDKIAIKAKLADFASRMEQLVKQIDSGQKMELVSSRYAELKRELEETFRRFETKKGEQSASSAELAYLFPATREAWLALEVKSGSKASKKMALSLASAVDYVWYYHGQL